MYTRTGDAFGCIRGRFGDATASGSLYHARNLIIYP